MRDEDDRPKRELPSLSEDAYKVDHRLMTLINTLFHFFWAMQHDRPMPESDKLELSACARICAQTLGVIKSWWRS